MSKIFDEVRQISSQKIAEKQKASENNYPKLIEKIKKQAAHGDTECQFKEYEIDQYSKRLLEQDGFTVYVTTRIRKDDRYMYFPTSQDRVESIWIVRW